MIEFEYLGRHYLIDAARLLVAPGDLHEILAPSPSMFDVARALGADTDGWRLSHADGYIKAVEDGLELTLAESAWLRRVVGAHREEVEHALIQQGLRLRDAEQGRVRWRDVYIVARFAPPGSPLARALDPEGGSWTLDQAMQAVRIDQTNNLLWGLGGGKGPRPKPVRRPWADPDASTEVETFRGEAMTLDEADELAARFRGRPMDDAEAEHADN